MKCAKSGTEFPATWRETYPGATKSGADLVLGSIAELVVMVLLIGLGMLAEEVNVRKIAFIFGALAFLFSIGGLFRIPDHQRVKEEHGGGECPACGERNEVRWFD